MTKPADERAELTTDEKLVILMEECAEVIKAASKCLRFGYTRNHPSYGDNDKVLSSEVGDLLGIVESLPLDATLMQEARETKIARAEKAKELYGK